MRPKTVIEKSPASSPDVTVFKISGTLGFHEKVTLEKLFGECRKRRIQRVVLDVEGLSSLGGGCAAIIQDAAAADGMVIGVAAAKKTVLKFLLNHGSGASVVTADTVDETIAGVLARTGETPDGSPPEEIKDAAVDAPTDDIPPEDSQGSPPPDRPTPPKPLESADIGSDDELVSDDVLDQILARTHDADVTSTPEAVPADETVAPPPSDTDTPQAAETKSPSANNPPSPASTEMGDADAPQSPRATGAHGDDAERNLKKRIIQYNTLLSINNDFARIHDRKSLLDAFLLTVIAQVGVESAVFLQRSQGYFYPVSMKGVESDEVRGLALEEFRLGLHEWQKTRDIVSLDDAPFDDDARAPLTSLGCSYVAPFIVHGDFRAVVLLGRPLRGDLDANTIEFLKILVNQAALAYESTSLLEEENERTLGLVQTLIALIEENTLARGNTKMLSNYVYALANEVHYPEEHLRDLMYGTVLRDIGMIKVSDLIVRSPRELLAEEWEIIKRHPIDGADMLRRMKFSEHAVKIVLCHHERFNGEGYPRGLQGQQSPLGARVVSVVESYVAMLEQRPTRPALSQEEALNTLKENWGMRYDPELVKQFVEIIEHEIRSGETVANKKFELFSV